MAVEAFPAGWYQDYQDAAMLRWWDGTQWTVHTQLPPGAGAVLEGGPGGAASGAPGMGAGQPVSGRHERRPASKRDLNAEVDRLRQALGELGATERDQLAAEVSRLRDEVLRLRGEYGQLSAAVVPLRAEVQQFAAAPGRAGRRGVGAAAADDPAPGLAGRASPAICAAGGDAGDGGVAGGRDLPVPAPAG